MADQLCYEILSALGHLVLQYGGAGSFAVVGAAPDWKIKFPSLADRTTIHVLELLETFPVLEAGLMNLESLWYETRNSVKQIGEWADVDSERREIHLRASVLTVGGLRVLLISAIDPATVDLIRRARLKIHGGNR